MKRNLFLLPAILFLSTGLFAQNHLFWYPDTCLKSDLNTVLDNLIDAPPTGIDVSFKELLFGNDSFCVFVMGSCSRDDAEAAKEIRAAVLSTFYRRN